MNSVLYKEKIKKVSEIIEENDRMIVRIKFAMKNEFMRETTP